MWLNTVVKSVLLQQICYQHTCSHSETLCLNDGDSDFGVLDIKCVSTSLNNHITSIINIAEEIWKYPGNTLNDYWYVCISTVTQRLESFLKFSLKYWVEPASCFTSAESWAPCCWIFPVFLWHFLLFLLLSHTRTQSTRSSSSQLNCASHSSDSFL